MKAAKHLNDNEYKFLLKMHANHNRNMGIDERKKYTLSDIVKVKRNVKEKCLEVYFKNGDWWHYSTDGTWY